MYGEVRASSTYYLYTYTYIYMYIYLYVCMYTGVYAMK